MHQNKINQKAYIGQTTLNPARRWGAHGEGYKGCILFYNAIQKYGWENFEHIILEQNIPQSKLNEREQFWIKQYKSYDDHFGYNLTLGGNQMRTEQQCKDLGDKIKKWNKAHPQQVQQNIERLKQYWEQHPLEAQQHMAEMREKAKIKNSKKVLCIETNISYDSAREAGRQTGISYSGIAKACRGELKTSGGYHWKYIQD